MLGESSRYPLKVPAAKFSCPVATSLSTIHLPTTNVLDIIFFPYLPAYLGM